MMQTAKVGALMMLCVSGCHTQSGALQPARAQALSDEGINEIVQIIAAETGRDVIRISAAAFARSHILLLDSAPRRSLQHGVIDARESSQPLRFHLLTDGRRCYLSSEQTGVQVALSTVQCSSDNS